MESFTSNPTLRCFSDSVLTIKVILKYYTYLYWNKKLKQQHPKI